MKNHKLLYTSSYDRGLEWLLQMWPDIKKKFPDATLDICYGWDTFNKMLANNPERQQWKLMMISQMSQDGVKEHGRLGKKELRELRESCGILAYPSHFYEIFCISAVEAQLDGVVPVVTSFGALTETVKYGVIVEGKIEEEETRKEYLKELLSLMGDESRRKKLAEQGKEWAKKFDWTLIAKEWEKAFLHTDTHVKVSVYTPTIRKGWWNIMGNNLSKQTYQNFEWIIVDDYPEDRSELAKEYAKKYKLDIKYLRGKKRNVKRKYGLCNANNTALEQATGEILVFLQDFVLIPYDGIEQIVTLYKRNPTALQALPDMYYYPKFKPEVEKEDWFDRKTDIVGEFIRQNIRIQNLGLRKTDNPYDFEQNYGAIPVKVAKELGGWYEFYDFGLGFDNTSIAYRALQKGYEIILDETNVAICLDHWETLRGKNENGGMERARRLNDPLYLFEKEMIRQGKLPLTRTQEIDDKIDLTYEVPKDVTDDQMEEWIKQNNKRLAIEFVEKYKDL